MTRKHIIRFGAWLTTSVMFLALAMQAGCGSGEEVQQTNETDSTTYASLDPSNGYVGQEACSSCHQSIYDSFIQTGMGKSFDIASEAKSNGDFKKHAPVYDP
ncbi:MAG: hypothetical protein ACKO9S_06185, partial [Bacteroidota bacterium]